jgi:hypothetical protein
MHALLIILVIVLLAGIAMGLFFQQRLHARLRSQHPTAMEVLDQSSAGIMAFQRYLWRRHYLGLGDAPFTRRADSVRRYWKACFLYFLLVILALLAAWLGTREARSPVQVGVAFIHREAYPNARFTAWITNRTSRRISLGQPAVRFHTESGLEAGGLIWGTVPWKGGIDPPGPGVLRPGAIATLTVPARDYYKEARLEFEYAFDADPVRRAVSKVTGFAVRRLGLRPQIDSDPLVGRPQGKRATRPGVWQWLYDNGMLNGRLRRSYEGPWVPWEK